MGLLDNISQIDCSTITCAGVLPVADVTVVDCVNDLTQSEINSIIIWNPTVGTAITNWPATGSGGLAALDFAINNADATDVAQKQFFGVGTVAAPEETEVSYNDGQSTVINKKFSLTFTSIDIGDSTYDYWRSVQCGKVKPKLSYTDRGGYIYSISGGIATSKWTVAFPKNTGDDSVNQAEITVTWDADTDPDRAVYPL